MFYLYRFFKLSKWNYHEKKFYSRVLDMCKYLSSGPRSFKSKDLDMSVFEPDIIRNFSIVAHVDHGKSTLADRLLEYTGTILVDAANKQVLDRLPVERERGITVKAQTASLIYEKKGISYLLNLIDTPGHVDFNYEVSRSLAACQGCVLLVDANQGIQAQTVANFYLAFESELCIVPVLNKCDLPGADPEAVSAQMQTVLDFRPDEFLQISAKTGRNVSAVLDAVVDRILPPTGDRKEELTALIFDSWYDRYRGAICMIAVKHGKIASGDRVKALSSGKTYEVQSVGLMHPDETPTTALYAGQVGFMVCGMRSVSEAVVGDTVRKHNSVLPPLPGFRKSTPMVFAGVFPLDQSEYGSLRNALERLTLNDSSVSVQPDSSPALGQGWRLGFLGLLHLGVFRQRLEQEHGASIVVTAPSVTYHVKLKRGPTSKRLKRDEITVLNPLQFPDAVEIESVEEPVVLGTIICPTEHYSGVVGLCMDRRGVQKETINIDANRVMMKFLLPLSEILVDFFDQLKSSTSGYGSFDYEERGFQATDVVKLRILLNGQEVDELTCIVHVSNARSTGRVVCEKLHANIPRQLFEIVIQATVGGKIVARETVKALRKNVTAKCYGGDITRKMKLLKRQAEGKKKMRMVGRVEVPKDAFLSILTRS